MTGVIMHAARPIRLRSRLSRLERQAATIAPDDPLCPVCGSGPCQQISFWHLGQDGTERLISGPAPAPCPRCGREGKKGTITRIVVVEPAEAGHKNA
jgi:hypothetical protein